MIILVPPTDCKQLYDMGYRGDGVYNIDPDGQGSFQAYCELDSNREDGSTEGGYTVFQRRVDGTTDFYR